MRLVSGRAGAPGSGQRELQGRIPIRARAPACTPNTLQSHCYLTKVKTYLSGCRQLSIRYLTMPYKTLNAKSRMLCTSLQIDFFLNRLCCCKYINHIGRLIIVCVFFPPSLPPVANAFLPAIRSMNLFV